MRKTLARTVSVWRASGEERRPLDCWVVLHVQGIYMVENHWTAEDYDWLVGFSGDWRDRWYNNDFLQLMAK